MDRFKAYKISDIDKKTSAAFVDVALDDLDPDDVVVRVAYSDVNFKDALAATGKGRILMRPACIGGIDLSGTVVSSADARFAPGDAVVVTGFDLGVAHDGGYAEYARVPGDWIVPLPEGLSLLDAMALGTAGFTAALGIVRMEHDGLTPSSGPVIVSGATGGVGSIAIDVLSCLGYEVVALTGKEAETDYLKRIGASKVLLRQSLDLQNIRPLGKGQWAGAVDNLGGGVLAWMASTMKTGGTIASIGLAATPTLSTTVLPFILRGVSLLGIESAMCPMPLRQQVWQRLAGAMRPRHLAQITKTVAFNDLPTVFDAFINGNTRGRTVVAIGGHR